MSKEQENGLNRRDCGPLPWFPRERRGLRDIVCPMAEVPLGEIRRSFEALAEKYPPILSVEQAAELAQLAPSTLKRKISEGCYKESVSPGKPLRIWRDRFVREIMR